MAAAALSDELGDGGVLVNVSSGAATLGSPHEYGHYAEAKDADRVGPRVPLGRAGEPDEVAAAIECLMSDAERALTATAQTTPTTLPTRRSTVVP